MKEKYLQPYSEDWARKFNDESTEIKSILGGLADDVQHIGSTSISGTLAKPIIDIAVLVDSITDVEMFVNRLKALGYEYKPEMSSAERIFLRKGNPVEFHLSITSPRLTFWTRQILFRDYLIDHQDLVAEYNLLKRNNLAQTPSEELSDLSLSKSYNQGKDAFVKKVLELTQF